MTTKVVVGPKLFLNANEEKYQLLGPQY